VLVTGTVTYPNSFRFEKGKDYLFYIQKAGGILNGADLDAIHVIKPNGEAQSKFMGIDAISPGDIIVVPKKTDI